MCLITTNHNAFGLYTASLSLTLQYYELLIQQVYNKHKETITNFSL